MRQYISLKSCHRKTEHRSERVGHAQELHRNGFQREYFKARQDKTRQGDSCYTAKYQAVDRRLSSKPQGRVEFGTPPYDYESGRRPREEKQKDCDPKSRPKTKTLRPRKTHDASTREHAMDLSPLRLDLFRRVQTQERIKTHVPTDSKSMLPPHCPCPYSS